MPDENLEEQNQPGIVNHGDNFNDDEDQGAAEGGAPESAGTPDEDGTYESASIPVDKEGEPIEDDEDEDLEGAEDEYQGPSPEDMIARSRAAAQQQAAQRRRAEEQQLLRNAMNERAAVNSLLPRAVDQQHAQAQKALNDWHRKVEQIVQNSETPSVDLQKLGPPPELEKVDIRQLRVQQNMNPIPTNPNLDAEFSRQAANEEIQGVAAEVLAYQQDETGQYTDTFGDLTRAVQTYLPASPVLTRALQGQGLTRDGKRFALSVIQAYGDQGNQEALQQLDAMSEADLHYELLTWQAVYAKETQAALDEEEAESPGASRALQLSQNGRRAPARNRKAPIKSNAHVGGSKTSPVRRRIEPGDEYGSHVTPIKSIMEAPNDGDPYGPPPMG